MACCPKSQYHRRPSEWHRCKGPWEAASNEQHICIHLWLQKKGPRIDGFSISNMIKSAAPFIFKIWTTAAMDSHGLNKVWQHLRPNCFKLKLTPKGSGLACHQLTSMQECLLHLLFPSIKIRKGIMMTLHVQLWAGILTFKKWDFVSQPQVDYRRNLYHRVFHFWARKCRMKKSSTVPIENIKSC